jgi:excinuclease ABC subunit C
VLERPKAVPDAPGSYQFKDADGRVIYVGKALSLKGRLASYFGDPAQLHPRTQQMLERARSVEWIQVRSEVEAIMLEYSLIKEHRPHFNVRLVDDKSYPFIAVTADETWPRVAIMRGTKRKGTRRCSTCSSGPSRCGPARTRSSPATSGSGGRVCCTTSSAARAPVSGR